MKIYKNILCLSLLFLSQSFMQAQQESTDTLLLESSNSLNALIAHAQENGTLSQQEQKHYVKWYVQFNKAITTLKNQGEDVSQLEQIYLDRYQDWAVELVTNSDLFLELFEPGDDETEQDAQEALSPEEEAYDKLRVEKMQEIYSNVENNALKAQQAFSTQVKLQLNNLGSFSTKHVQDFTAYLSSSLQSFIGSMRVAKMSAYNQYYSFLEKEGKQSDDPRSITPDERYLFDSIETITQEAILHVQALVLDMTSSAVASNMGLQIAEALKQSEAQAKKDYDAQLAENQQAMDQSWWDSVKAAGGTLIDEFSSRFKDELIKQVKKQAKDAAVKFGSDVAKGAAKSVTEPINEQLTELSSKLEHETLSKVIKDYGDPAVKALKRTIRMVSPVIDKPLATEVVQVQSSLGLCDEEKEYLANRLPKVQRILKSEFDIDQPLRLAFCCSGGGNRAMIGTLGFFIAAARHKFLDASMYMTGLSGSTWTIVPWSYLYLKNMFRSKDFETTLTAMRDSFALELQGAGILKPPFLKSDQVIKDFSQSIAVRFGFDQHLSAVDIFGGLVGNYALSLAGNNRLHVKWSELAVAAKAGRIPLPLASAAFNANMKTDTKTKVGASYDWFEMSPFQAGSSMLGYIPTRWLGSEFKNGKIVPEFITPEYPISFYLGVYGSAFGLSLHDVVDKGLPDTSFMVSGIKVNVPVDQWVKEILKESFGQDAGAARSGKIHARFPNFSLGVSLRNLIQDEKEIGLFDAGIAFNFPLPLLLDRPQRAVDVIIIYDSNPGDVPVFKDAEQYFIRKNIAIPDLSSITKIDAAQAKAKLLSSAMTVFNDPRTKSYNPNIVTFIYFPTPVDVKSMPFTTANFGYSTENINTLIGIVQESFESQVPEMKKILKLVAQKRFANAEKPKWAAANILK